MPEPVLEALSLDWVLEPEREVLDGRMLGPERLAVGVPAGVPAGVLAAGAAPPAVAAGPTGIIDELELSRPAGIVATGGWLVTTAGWDVNATVWDVKTAGMPVTMLRLLVKLRYCSESLVGLALCARATAPKDKTMDLVYIIAVVPKRLLCCLS